MLTNNGKQCTKILSRKKRIYIFKLSYSYRHNYNKKKINFCFMYIKVNCAITQKKKNV